MRTDSMPSFGQLSKFAVRATVLLTLILAGAVPAQTAANDAKKNLIFPSQAGHYDEVFREIPLPGGRVKRVLRPEYQEIAEVAAKLTPFDIRNGEILTYNAFQTDNVLNLVPRVILDTDFKERLEPGIDQRGRAIREFLKDFHSTGGRPAIARSGLIPQETLDRIVRRNGESWLAGRVNPDSISMFYGPDIIRDVGDQFRVIEDNTGYLGGLGDLKLALEALYKNVPYPKLHSHDPMNFYRDLARRFQQRANPVGGKVVLLMTPPYPDYEGVRIMNLMKEVGITVITPNTKSQLEIDKNGDAWVRNPDRQRRERVGFIAIEGEYWWLDAHHPEMRKTAVIEWSQMIWEQIEEIHRSVQSRSEKRANANKAHYASKAEQREVINRTFLMMVRKFFELPSSLPVSEVEARLKRFHAALTSTDPSTGQPSAEALEALFRELNLQPNFRKMLRESHKGLFEALSSGKIPTNYSPGTNFTNDKEFYTYMEKVIWFYLREEPILKNIETLDPRLERSGKLDRRLHEAIRKNQKDWVIKVVDGRGGKGIWVGAKSSEKEFAKGLAAVAENPERYRYQRYTPLSELAGMIVDVRIHSDIPPKGRAYVSRTPWGRGLPQNGDGKVNISSSGKEVTVIIRRAQRYCENMFVPTN